MDTELYPHIFDIMTHILCVMDTDANVLTTNKAWEDTLGFAKEETAGKSFIEYVHPKDAERALGLIRRLRNGQTGRLSVLFGHAGEYKHIDWHMVRDDDKVYAAAKDIIPKVSEVKKGLAVFDESETIFNATTDALFLVHVDGNNVRYIKNNPAHRKLTGLNHIEGKSPEELVGAKMGKQISGNYKRCIKNMKPMDYDETLTLPAGKRIWHTMLTPVVLEGAFFIVGSSRDITEQKRAEEQVRHNLKGNISLVNILQHEASSEEAYLDFALHQALDLTESAIGCIYFYDEGTQAFTLDIWSTGKSKKADQPMASQMYETGVWRDAVKRREPIIANDYASSDLNQKSQPDKGSQLKRFLSLPVFDGKKIVAVIGVANKKDSYNETDIWQLTLLMNNVWKTIERMRSEQKLFEEKERLRTTLMSVGDGVIVTDADGHVDMMNDIAEKLTGWRLAEAKGKLFADVFHIFDEYTRKKCVDPVSNVLKNGRITELANHTILKSKNGEDIPIADSAAPIMQNKEIKGVILVFRDVSAQKQKQALIEKLSYHDQLTGLYNRHFFECEINRIDRHAHLPISFIIADVNGLKLTNDAFGHSVGDRLLVKAAKVIQSCCRKKDIVARLGGDEFVVLLPKTDEAYADEIASRIMKKCSKVKVKAVTLSISCGCSAKINSKDMIHEVMKTAEDRMYKRKLFEGPSIRSKIINSVVQALYEANCREQQHSERVSVICEKMACALGCPDRDVQELKMAGLLHDVGKVAIDTSVLDKEGRLEESEWAEVKRHPEIGYRILNALNDMSEIAQIALTHHERWDGKGYPQGLKGEEIPIQARILAIADAYDAMIFGRPYRAPMKHNEIVDEIIDNAGVQFDPDLVSVFIKDVMPGLKDTYSM